jgi:hypothetical protein
MNIIGKTVVCLILSIRVAYGAVRGDLPEFAAVRYERGVLVLTTHKSQWRMAGQIGVNGVWKTLPADSDIDIPLGERSGFAVSKHYSISFTPLAEGNGLVFLRQTNLLSLRRGLKEESFSINIGSDGEVTYGEVTIKNLTSADVVKNSAVREAPQEDEGKGSSQQVPPAEEKPPGPESAAPPDQGVPSTGQTGPETKTAAAAEDNEVASPAAEKPWLLIGMAVLVGGLALAFFLKKN